MTICCLTAPRASLLVDVAASRQTEHITQYVGWSTTTCLPIGDAQKFFQVNTSIVTFDCTKHCSCEPNKDQLINHCVPLPACAENAICTVLNNGFRGCKCNGNYIGDGCTWYHHFQKLGSIRGLYCFRSWMLPEPMLQQSMQKRCGMHTRKGPVFMYMCRTIHWEVVRDKHDMSEQPLQE